MATLNTWVFSLDLRREHRRCFFVFGSNSSNAEYSEIRGPKWSEGLVIVAKELQHILVLQDGAPKVDTAFKVYGYQL